jgi:hypothetical protein
MRMSRSIVVTCSSIFVMSNIVMMTWHSSMLVICLVSILVVCSSSSSV